MSGYISKFSGHQTFPLRYGWLYKYLTTESPQSQKAEDLMVDWGVGKNMVDSIKYWANQIGLDSQDSVYQNIIHDHDVYLENLNSVWILHWILCRNPKNLSAYSIFFNYFNGQNFDKENLLAYIKELFKINSFKSSSKTLLKIPSDSTLNRDISTMLLTYTKSNTAKVSEDSFTSPLAELSLIQSLSKTSFISQLESRPSLDDVVFTYAVIDFFRQLNTNSTNVLTMAFDTFLTSAGSPARVFRLSQLAVEQRLERVNEITENAIGWTDSQGLRQIFIKEPSILQGGKDLNILQNLYTR